MPDGQTQPDSPSDATEIRFKRPDSYVVSVRLNRDESETLTEEARRAGEKLSSFIKAAALETCQRRELERASARFEIGGSATGTAWTLLQGRGNSPSATTGREDATPPSMRRVSYLAP